MNKYNKCYIQYSVLSVHIYVLAMEKKVNFYFWGYIIWTHLLFLNTWLHVIK
jgi:hypothetical protein